jgi:pimeloyl-ACP methyl ester carboxylesterase
VKVLHQLLDQEHLDTVDLIGHSMGTMVVSEFAARYPDRVDRLVLTGGPIISVLDLPNHPFQTLRRRPQVATFVVEALTAGIKLSAPLENLIVHRRWARWAAFRVYVPHPERIDHDVFAGVLRGVGARAVLPTVYGGWWWRYDLRNALVNVTCPTLVIAGERDTIAPPGDIEEFARIARTKVTIERLPDTGHAPMLEQPKTFNRLVTSFLAEGG